MQPDCGAGEKARAILNERKKVPACYCREVWTAILVLFSSLLLLLVCVRHALRAGSLATQRSWAQV